MQNAKFGAATVLGAAILVGAPTTRAMGKEVDPPPDPAVVAAREAQAADPTTVVTNPPVVAPTKEGAPAEEPPPTRTGARVRDLYNLRAVSTSGGYIEVAARDNPAQDRPGRASTTMRVYGNAAAIRRGAGPIILDSSFTCTGASIDVSIGTGGVQITGGYTGKTARTVSGRQAATEVRQFYTEGGHYRCKALNAAPAHLGHQIVGSAQYKDNDVRAQDSYGFWW